MGCILEKEFTKFLYMNILILLCLIVNQADLCHSYVSSPLT